MHPSEYLMELVMEDWNGPFSIERITVFSWLLQIFLQRFFHLHNCLAPGRQFHILSSSNLLKLRFHVIKLLQKDTCFAVLSSCSIERLCLLKEKKGWLWYLKSILTIAKILAYLMSSYATAASARKLCADDCLFEMHIFQALKKHSSPRALLSPAVDDPQEFVRPFSICDKTQYLSVFACDYSVGNSLPD